MLAEKDFDLLFNKARTYNGWKDKPVTKDQIEKIYDLVKMAPTSANCSPARFLFLTTDEAKARLKPYLDEGNVKKTMAAPVVTIIGHDMEFYENLPKLFPHTDAKSWFVGNDDLIKQTAFRNGTLQGAYLIMAIRALGLDAGPMSGFDQEGVNKEFFAGTSVKANFLCSIGHGDPESLYPRAPRLDFDEAAEIL